MENIKIWIARDKDGHLYVYLDKPVLNAGVEFFPPYRFSDDWLDLPKDYYPEVTFDNSLLPLEVLLDYGK